MSSNYRVPTGDKASTWTYKAGGTDMTAKAGRILVDDSGKVDVGVNATTAPVGVLVEAGSSATDSPVTVCIMGPCKVHLNGTVGEQAFLACDTNGDAIATTTADDYCIGKALEDGVDGDFIWANINIDLYSID